MKTEELLKNRKAGMSKKGSWIIGNNPNFKRWHDAQSRTFSSFAVLKRQ